MIIVEYEMDVIRKNFHYLNKNQEKCIVLIPVEIFVVSVLLNAFTSILQDMVFAEFVKATSINAALYEKLSIEAKDAQECAFRERLAETAFEERMTSR